MECTPPSDTHSRGAYCIAGKREQGGEGGLNTNVCHNHQQQYPQQEQGDGLFPEVHIYCPSAWEETSTVRGELPGKKKCPPIVSPLSKIVENRAYTLEFGGGRFSIQHDQTPSRGGLPRSLKRKGLEKQKSHSFIVKLKKAKVPIDTNQGHGKCACPCGHSDEKHMRSSDETGERRLRSYVRGFCRQTSTTEEDSIGTIGKILSTSDKG